jgi:hypothetical protein
MKVSLNFSNVKDMDLALRFKGAGVKMKNNIRLFPKPAVDLDKFLAIVDEYSNAITLATDGGKRAISQRNKLRKQAIKLATLLGHYVGYVADNDLETVYAAGFEPADKYRLLPKPLPKTGIGKVVRGPNSGTARVYIVPIPRSNGKVSYYELGYAPKTADGIGEFTVIPTTVARFPIAIKNLIPGTNYLFKVRASNKLGFNDWSDPVIFMAT